MLSSPRNPRITWCNVWISLGVRCCEVQTSLGAWYKVCFRLVTFTGSSIFYTLNTLKLLIELILLFELIELIRINSFIWINWINSFIITKCDSRTDSWTYGITHSIISIISSSDKLPRDILYPCTLGGRSDGKWRTPETEQCGDSATDCDTALS